MTNYGFVHLEYGSRHRDHSLQVLTRLRRQLADAGDRFTFAIVDNARATGGEALRDAEFPEALVVAGDNSNREFTGWDQGVASVLARGGEPDVWLFSNDTIALNHGWGARRVAGFGSEIKRLGLHPGPWLFGEINDFPRSTMTPLGPLLEWVATYCFAMNGNLRRQLGALSPGNEFLDSLVHDRFEPAHRLFRDSVDEAYVDFVSAWLIKDENDPSRQRRFKWSREWHKASALSPANFDDLRMKARCVLSESMLSVRARQLGADIRSPYDARNARAHVRSSLQLVADKLWEKFLLRRLRLERS